MPRVAAAVIAGGQGSAQTALASGLPFVGVPLQPEQDANVTVVTRRRAAIRVRPERVATQDLPHGRTLIIDGRYRQPAWELQRAYAAVDGPGACADLVVLEASAGSPIDATRRGDPA